MLTSTAVALSMLAAYARRSAKSLRFLHAGLAAKSPSRAGGPAECRTCGAPLFARSSDLSVNCPYCRTDNLVRIPDEWVDNPGALPLSERESLLDDWRSQLLRGLDGVLPKHPVMRAFCDVVRETGMPLEEPLRFLDAMRQDLTVSSYPTYESLRAYMRGSAAAGGDSRRPPSRRQRMSPRDWCAC